MSDPGPFETTPPALLDDGEEDPAADFLAREQDELAAIDDGPGLDTNGGQPDAGK